MKIIAIAVGSALTALATSASAQVYLSRSYTYEPYVWSPRVALDERHECWNFRARQFEQVRPGEYQDDLDFGRCRVIGGRVYESRAFVDRREECWNPRAGHFETVRPGERQDDLDYGRCRVVTGDLIAYQRYPWR